MTNEITTMQTLQEKVSERIRATFIDLIPQAMWDDMVRKAMDQWVRDELPKLVNAEAEKRAKEELVKAFNGAEWQDLWVGGQAVGSKAVQTIVGENAEAFVAAMFGGIVQRMVTDMRYRLQSGQF